MSSGSRLKETWAALSYNSGHRHYKMTELELAKLSFELTY